MTSENPVDVNPAAGNQAPQGPMFGVKRIFLKDISFEMPGGIETFGKKWQPKVSQDLNTEIDGIDEQHYLVTLKMTITVKLEDKVAYLIEVHQSGVFQIAGVDEDLLKQALTVQCPHILYPYVREAVDNVVVKGGFPPLALPPINFEAIVAGAEAQAAAAGNGEDRA